MCCAAKPPNEADQYTHFLADLVEAHAFFQGTSSAPPDAVSRLIPWAFPNWPARTSLGQMTVSAFLDFAGNGGEVASVIRENTSDELASLWADLNAGQPSFCSYAVPSFGDLAFEDVTAPVLRFDAKLESYKATRTLLGLEISDDPTPTVRMMDKMGFRTDPKFNQCLRTCQDPFAAGMQGCEDACWADLGNREAPDSPWTANFSGSLVGTCDAMNAAYRAECLRQREVKRDREVANCAPLYTINTPDALDWTTFTDISQCAGLPDATQVQCLNHFWTIDPLNTARQQTDSALRAECTNKFCGGCNDTDATADAMKEDEEYKALRAKSEATREALEEAYEKVEADLAEGYTLSISRGDDGRGKTSKAHHFGGAIDVVLKGPGGRAATRKEYEALQSLFEEAIAGISGVQTVIELPIASYPSAQLDLSDLNPNGKVKLATALGNLGLADIADTVDLAALPADVQTAITTARNKVKALFLYDVENPAGEKFYTVGTHSSGVHLHVGKPSYSFKAKPRY